MSQNRPAIIGFCGASNSGKTTLVAKVIENLSARGLKVGAVKHHGHPDPIPVPGDNPEKQKDSARLAMAGARRVALSHSGGIILTAGRPEAHLDPRLIVENYMQGMDVVIVEGYKHAHISKIEVVAPGRKPILPKGGSILALAARGEGLTAPEPGYWVLDADDPAAVAQFVVDYYNL